MVFCMVRRFFLKCVLILEGRTKWGGVQVRSTVTRGTLICIVKCRCTPIMGYDMMLKLSGQSRAGWFAIFTSSIQLPILECLCLKGYYFFFPWFPFDNCDWSTSNQGRKQRDTRLQVTIITKARNSVFCAGFNIHDVCRINGSLDAESGRL